MPAAAALRMILSSTSVMFITWRTWRPRQQQKAAKHVNLQESTEVSDVAVVVDRGAARIHPHGFAVFRKNSVELSGQGVVQAESHWRRVLHFYHAGVEIAGLKACLIVAIQGLRRIWALA